MSSLYDFGRQGVLDGSFNWASGTIKVALVSAASYTPNLATDEFVSDIPSGAIVARSAALASKGEAAGVASAANVTYGAVSGAQVDYLVLYQDSGTDTSSRLIALIDTATGLPFTPSGGGVTIVWDTGVNKIFRL